MADTKHTIKLNGTRRLVYKICGKIGCKKADFFVPDRYLTCFLEVVYYHSKVRSDNTDLVRQTFVRTQRVNLWIATHVCT